MEGLREGLREKLAAPVTKFFPKSSATITGQEYLHGLRGLLVIESFLWVFLQTFVPAAVKDAALEADGPFYQVALRKSLSVLFWNENLLYSFFILLSARNLPIPFFTEPSKTAVASAVFRRGLRLWFPTAVALAIPTLAFSQLGLDYITEFKNATGNESFNVPYFLSNALIYFNSVFNLFWQTNSFFSQSGSTAFPSQTLWIVNVIYQQSFTVFMVMVITPYTRSSWRVKGAIAFVLTAWWVQSWAWFSITGLLLADMVMNMNFRQAAQRGIPIPIRKGFRIPCWIPYLILMAAGIVMQYLWTAWRPSFENAEIQIHAGLYYGGELNTDVDPSQPEARDDNYLLILGFMFCLETFDWLQMIFRNPLFVYLGKRSLST